MSVPTPQKLRLKVILTPFGTAVVDQQTGLAPRVWRNLPCTVDIGVFIDADTPAALTDFDAVEMDLRPKEDRASGLYVNKTTGTITAELTKNNWEAGTHEHATLELTAEDLNLDLATRPEGVFWLFVGLVDGTPANIAGAGCLLTVIEPGWGAPGAAAQLNSYATATPYGDGAVAEGDWSEVVAITGMTATGHVDVQKTSEGPAIDRVEYDTDQIEVFLVAPAAPGDVTFKYITHRKS